MSFCLRQPFLLRLAKNWTKKLHEKCTCGTVSVGDTETTRNHIGMQGQKCRSYKLWCKEEEKKKSNSNTLMGQKMLYITVVLQKVFDNTTRSCLGDLAVVLHRILTFWKIPDMHPGIFATTTDIRAISFSTEGTGVS
ncbi:hypothetical protein TNCV_546371 [Trichonephila clavipes]|nr:hypothetical protein TNCV_546371 [Trichonephila clavipes]